MARRVPSHVRSRLRREGKLFTRKERRSSAEQSLRDAQVGYGRVTPAGMRFAWRAGVHVSTIAEIAGKSESEVKEAIGMDDTTNSDFDGQTRDPAPPPFDQASTEPNPDSTPDAAQGDDAPDTERDAPQSDARLSSLTDAELADRAAGLRQAGKADDAAAYDRELESRSGANDETDDSGESA